MRVLYGTCTTKAELGALHIRFRGVSPQNPQGKTQVKKKPSFRGGEKVTWKPQQKSISTVTHTKSLQMLIHTT